MLEVVGEILSAYQKEHGISFADKGPPILNKFLRPLIEERGLVDKIYFYEADIESKHIYGMVERFEAETSPYSGLLAHAKIYYKTDLNFCWRRFVVCKEMFHCMIDKTEDDRVSNLGDLERLMELLSADTTALTGEFPPFESEQKAKLMALETLFPVEFRGKYLDEPITNPKDFDRLADKFKIPALYIKIACSPNYMRQIIKLRRRLLKL